MNESAYTGWYNLSSVQRELQKPEHKYIIQGIILLKLDSERKLFQRPEGLAFQVGPE